jgi:hypothetical protein
MRKPDRLFRPKDAGGARVVDAAGRSLQLKLSHSFMNTIMMLSTRQCM